MRRPFILTISSFFLYICVTAQNKISPEEAAKHYGETITICDRIFEDNFTIDPRTKNAVITLGNGPGSKVLVVVNAESSKKLTEKPRNYYANKSVCITGKVVEFRGKPEILVTKEDKILFTDESSGPGEIKPNDFMRFE